MQAFELEIIHWLQSWGLGFWEGFFSFWTMFGEEAILIGVMGFIYWCYDKKSGEFIGLTVFLSQIVNSVVKLAIARPRPFVVDSGIENLRPKTATGYSFPSGHTQGAASTFAATSFRIKKPWLTIATAIIIVMVAISRMYLGAHFLSDVLAGGLLGVGIAWGLSRWTNHLNDTKKLYNGLLIVSLVVMVGMIIFGWYTIGAENLVPDAMNFYDKLEGLVKMSAAFLGFVVGLRFEQQKVQFDIHRVWWKNVIRLVLGIIVLLAIKEGLKAIFQLIVPTEEGDLLEGEFLQATLGLALDFVRYAVMVFAGIGLYPLLFKKIHI